MIKTGFWVATLLMAIYTPLQAQVQRPGTVLLLKKNGNTLQRFYPSQNITFLTTSGNTVEAELNSFTRDSLFLTYYQQQVVPGMAGIMRTDTAGKYTLQFATSEIAGFPRRPKARLISGILVLGGGAYLGVNAVNTIREKQAYLGNDNLPRVIGGLSAIAAGLLIRYLQPSAYKLGRKYTLEVVE